MNFDTLWQMLYDHGATTTKRWECSCLWDRLTPEQQEQLVNTISTKLRQDKFVHFDPLRAMHENIRKPKQKQTLTFSEYYAKFGTTEVQPGWHMENPTGQQVVYVKGGGA